METTFADRGELLYERRGGCSAIVIGFLVTLIGPVLLFCTALLEMDWNWQLLGGAATASLVGLLFLLGGVYGRTQVLRLYEQGIEQNNRYIVFDDVEVFTANLITMITGGLADTTCRVVLAGQDAAGPFTVCFSIGNLGSDFSKKKGKITEFLLRAAAEPVTRRMKQTLEATGRVDWAEHFLQPAAYLQASTIVLREYIVGGPRFIKCQSTEVPYSELEVELDKGFLSIRCANGYKMNLRARGRNFFPGYQLLLEKMGISDGEWQR